MPPNGRICCERDARAPLDPQILARDEQRLARRSSCAAPPPAPELRAGGRRRRRRVVHPARGDPDLARREPGGPRRARATPATRCGPPTARRARPRRAPTRPCSSRPACGSSSSRSRGSRASAIASETRRRWPCESRPCVTSRRPVERRGARARRRRRPPTGRPPASRTGCSPARSDRRSRRSRGRRARASGESSAGRSRDRRRAPRPIRTAAATAPRTAAAGSSCPRRSRPPAARSRPPRPRDRRPRARGIVRACKQPTEGARHARGLLRERGAIRRECTKRTGRAAKRSPEVRQSGRSAQVPSTAVRRTIAAIGRMLVTLGLLILLFVTYELWGTGIFTARAQHRLKNQFHQRAPAGAAHDNPVVTAPTTNPEPRHKTATRPPRTINPTFRGRAARGRDHRRDQ